MGNFCGRDYRGTMEVIPRLRVETIRGKGSWIRLVKGNKEVVNDLDPVEVRRKNGKVEG